MDSAPAMAQRHAATPSELARYRLDPRLALGHDHIVCLVCGLVFRQLTNTHIRRHGMTPVDYKATYGYNRGRPLMCRALLGLYAERAVLTKLADRIRRRPIVERPELRRLAGARPIVLEESPTRRDIQRRPRGRFSVRDDQARFSSDRSPRRA